MTKWLQTLIAYICLLVPIAHAQSSAEALYRQANALYEQGQYQQAIEIYAQIAAASEHAAVFYNLGNAYFRLGQRGLAILNYERAKRLAPRDKDIDFNLKVARAQNVDGFDLVKPASGFSLLYGALRPNEMATVALIPCWIAAACFVAFQFPRTQRFQRPLRYAAIVGCVIWLGSLALLGLKTRELNVPHAIVVVEEVAVRSAPDAQAVEIAAPVHEGIKVEIQEQRGSWVRIYLPEENAGWLPAEAVVGI